MEDDYHHHARVRWLFLRALALVYLCAFASLWVQVEGLIGADGILPVRELLDFVRERTGPERYWLLPTVLWLDSGDGALLALCGAGAGLSVVLLLGFAPRAASALLWSLYLSVVGVGQVFLGYQWDALLLETGLLAILLAPGGWRPRPGSEPSLASLWLLRWLLFRLMFSSGLVKLASGDPTWRNFTALDFHYWTQPLPTWVGWYAHQSPAWMHRASVALMFALELAVPMLVFAGRRARLAAFFPLVALQALIAATGNYAFFNLLSAALCLILLDDAALPAWLRARFATVDAAEPAPRFRLADLALAAVVLPVSLMQFGAATGIRLPWPRPFPQWRAVVAPLESVNGYGLFAVMTTTRPEIVVEGSRDGVTWLPYEFRFKPDDPRRAPAFVAPHQPRLDWQMWFAALAPCERSPWLQRFLVRLREGSPAVRRLLARDPFAGDPPALVRAELYGYRFTDRARRRGSGEWWERRRLGLFCPVVGESLPPR
jgi:lipase maturation factor 1